MSATNLFFFVLVLFITLFMGNILPYSALFSWVDIFVKCLIRSSELISWF